MLDQAHHIDAANKQMAKETRRLNETERRRAPQGGQDTGGQGDGRSRRGRGGSSGVPYIAPEKWATMTFEERAEHHKKRQAVYAANKASTGPQTLPKESETQVAEQHQEVVVDKVPTDGMSIVTTATTPAPPGSVIHPILASNSRTNRRNPSPPQTDECSRKNIIP
jgi:hypothetical protein